MRTLRHIAGLSAFLFMLIMTSACHDDEVLDMPNSFSGNFKALWEIIDRHYCFLDDKDIDWQAVYTKYEPKTHTQISSYDMFRMFSEVLDCLQDGHVNLSSPFATSYYRGWWDQYPENFNERVILDHYLRFNYNQLGAYTYARMPGVNVGYIRVSSFSSSIGEGNLDWILNYLSMSAGIIIDVRNNGGGELTSVATLASRFISKRTLAGYISHKTGPGHSEFSTPRPFYYDPADQGHLLWGRPVVVLANRSTYSAANTFVAFMRSLSGNVTVVGSTTGGGSGMPFSSSLPCGWTLRFSACPMYDSQGNITEAGVEPTAGHAVDCTPEQFACGYDAILEHAVRLLVGPSTDQAE